MARFQHGWLRVESRKDGATWVLRFYVTREVDGKRVEHKIAVGLVSDLQSESAAWAEVQRQHLNLQINQPDFRGRLTFGDLAQHFMDHELADQSEAVDPKSHTTIDGYKRILKKRCLDKWGKRPALGIEPLEVETWLKALKRDKGYENPTLDKTRRVMSLVFKHGQRYGLIPRTEEANPMRFVRCKTISDYEALVLTPIQAYEVMMQLEEPERTLTLLAAATGLRISECLGLQWQDLNFEQSQIQVRRTWISRKIGRPKSKASKTPVPMHSLLAEFLQAWKDATPYSQPNDWVFASARCKGKQPRTSNMLVADHLRPAAIRAGVLKTGDDLRFGFHNLRHSLATFLVRIGTDPKTVQTLLRHSDPRITLGLYAHSVSEDRLAAQGKMLEAILPPVGVHGTNHGLTAG
jgi:integrase